MRSTVDDSTYAIYQYTSVEKDNRRLTKFVIWSQLNSIPTRVLESLVKTNTFSTQLSERVVSLALPADVIMAGRKECRRRGDAHCSHNAVATS